MDKAKLLIIDTSDEQLTKIKDADYLQFDGEIFVRKDRAVELYRAWESKQILDENAALPLHSVSERTLGINSCASLIKSMPIDQAIQIMKSDITGQPQTSVIDGQLVVAYVR